MSGEAETRRKRKKPPRAGTRVRIGGAGSRLAVRPGEGIGRKVPKTLVGGALGFFTVIVFWIGVAGDQWPRFVLGIALGAALVALSIWALIRSPIRPTFDQRWRPRRRIEQLDLTAWRALAEETGLPLSVRSGLPSIRGGHGGVALQLKYHQVGGARTVAEGTLTQPFYARLDIRPLRAEYHTPHDRATGDADFDREYRCECAEVDPVERYLTTEIRERIRAAGPELILVAGEKVEVTCEGYVGDPDRLRGLLKLVAAIARS